MLCFSRYEARRKCESQLGGYGDIIIIRYRFGLGQRPLSHSLFGIRYRHLTHWRKVSIRGFLTSRLAFLMIQDCKAYPLFKGRGGLLRQPSFQLTQEKN